MVRADKKYFCNKWDRLDPAPGALSNLQTYFRFNFKNFNGTCIIKSFIKFSQEFKLIIAHNSPLLLVKFSAWLKENAFGVICPMFALPLLSFFLSTLSGSWSASCYFLSCVNNAGNLSFSLKGGITWTHKSLINCMILECNCVSCWKKASVAASTLFYLRLWNETPSPLLSSLLPSSSLLSSFLPSSFLPSLSPSPSLTLQRLRAEKRSNVMYVCIIIYWHHVWAPLPTLREPSLPGEGYRVKLGW